MTEPSRRQSDPIEHAQGELLASPLPESFPALVVRREATGAVCRKVERIRLDQLPPGEVLIRVAWSSLNYKDALAAHGHPGVARQLPHVPGIDAAGHIVQVAGQAAASSLAVGLPVIVTGYELGAGQWGGWSRYIRVPADWVVPLPEGLTLRDAMILGTAGLTAAQSTRRLQLNDVHPEKGPVVVTGASGGVGSLAVAILAKLKYRVSASTGKKEAAGWLRNLGAADLLDRQQVVPESDKPLLPVRWAGGVDTVGGRTLTAMLRQTDVLGCVAACGLVGGADLNLTVYPFILRGVQLSGITSSLCPRSVRLELWQKLAGPWRPSQLDMLAHETTLEGLEAWIERIHRGQVQGRVIIRLDD